MTKVTADIVARDRGASKAFEKVAKEADKATKQVKEFGKSGEKSGKDFSVGFSKHLKGIGGRVSSAFKAGPIAAAAAVGGAAVGAAFIGTFQKALEQGDVKAKFAAQLGLTEQESAKAGKTAGELYTSNYGESLGAVNEAIKRVVQDTNVGLNSVDLKPVTAKVLDLVSVFDQDLGGVTRAVGQLVRTGLAKNATEALDIVTKGFQSGVDKADDFLDTLNEYGTQFRKLGISGAQATGILSQGLKAGARDADIVADAIKEFSIRAVDGSTTTAAGFKALGLSAKTMTETIARGGKPAAAGLDTVLDRLRKVKDPARQSQIAVQLFGTQAEDLGKALYSIDPSKAVAGLGQVAGAADKLDKTIGSTPQARVSSFFRTLKQGAVDSMAGVITAFDKGETAATGFQGELEKAAVWLKENRYQIAAVFVDISRGALSMAKVVLPVVKLIDHAFREFLGGILNGAAEAFGFLPKVGDKLKAAAKSFNAYSQGVDKGFDAAIKKAGEWDTALDRTSKELHLKANISDLQNKLKTARTELKDKNLTRERKAQITANIKSLTAQLKTAQRQVNNLHGKTVPIEIKFTSGGVNLSAPSRAARVGPGQAAGGPISGPGSGTSDQAGLFALSNKEWVIRSKSAQKYGPKAMASINAGTAAVFPMASGGPTWPAFDARYNAAAKRGANRYRSGFGPYGAALGFAMGQRGKPYVWGGVGPGGYDCSGFMSALTNIIRGKSPYSRVGSTASFPWGGFHHGAGVFSVGSFKGNPGHMAGTLLGVNVESRGGQGVVVGRGARGASNSLFGGNVWGLARGGRAGDAAYDLLDPHGRNYLGSGVVEALNRGALNRDRGGMIPRGMSLVHNGTRRAERVVPGERIVIDARSTRGVDRLHADWLANLVRTNPALKRELKVLLS